MTTLQDADDTSPRLDPLARSIINLLVAYPIPLSPYRMAPLLGMDDAVAGGEVDIEASCKKLHRILGNWMGSYFLLERESQMVRNVLVSSEYQKLGMTVLMRREHEPPLVWIPSPAEARFLEMKPSRIRGSGWGLFLRERRMVRQGTLLCEYRGRRLPRLPKESSLCPYTVRVQSEPSLFIDALDEDGSVMCLAAMINDCGPEGANVELCEVPGNRGRVFVMALRDIEEGEELYVSYGSDFWEGVKKGSTVGDTGPVPTNNDVVCRQCAQSFPVRIRNLHKTFCSDELLQTPIAHLDSLPVNDFTAVDDEMMYLTHRRGWGCLPTAASLRRRATYFVADSDAATFAHTHLDVVTLRGIEVVD